MNCTDADGLTKEKKALQTIKLNAAISFFFVVV